MTVSGDTGSRWRTLWRLSNPRGQVRWAGRGGERLYKAKRNKDNGERELLKGGGFGRKSATFGKSFFGCFLAWEGVLRYQEGKQPYGMCITDKVGSVSVFIGFSWIQLVRDPTGHQGKKKSSQSWTSSDHITIRIDSWSLTRGNLELEKQKFKWIQFYL